VPHFDHRKKKPWRPGRPPDKPRSEEHRADKPRHGGGRPQRPHERDVHGAAGLEKVFGKHSVEAVLLRRPAAIRRLVIAGRLSYYEAIVAECERRNVPIEEVPWPDFMRLGDFTDADKHQGILALVTPLAMLGDGDLDRLAQAKCVLALDQVSNPQNLAAILRSAAFFHADAVILMRHRSAELTPNVLRFAVGGAEFVDLYRVTNLAQTIDRLKDMSFRVFGLDERGERTLAQTQFAPQTVFVIGAEGEGLRQKTRERCDELVRIPGGRQGVESLNASVAATIALYEFARLRS
jgi:23S rRNA (guanosine2251-2'-O)-methyltransferase